MALRNPLVVISGQLQELPAGDSLQFGGVANITSGTATTIDNTASRVFVNPATVLAAHTITLPASPDDGDTIWFFFGGAIAAGNPVVTALTISPNSGQSILQTITPQTAVSGDVMAYSYSLALLTWFRTK